MVPGIAICLGLFIKMLDEHEISHKSLELIRNEIQDLHELIRNEIRSCKSAIPCSKQYFVHEEMLDKGTAVSRRSHLICKGCAVIPRTEVPSALVDMLAEIEDEGMQSMCIFIKCRDQTFHVSEGLSSSQEEDKIQHKRTL